MHAKFQYTLKGIWNIMKTTWHYNNHLTLTEYHRMHNLHAQFRKKSFSVGVIYTKARLIHLVGFITNVFQVGVYMLA